MKYDIRFVLVGMTAMLAATSAQAGNLVQSITSAPVVPDGDVAGRITDLVITFDISLDPNFPGRTLLKGKTIKVTLPDAFVNTGKLPTMDVFTPGCKPPTFGCNTAVLLQGWPQRPIRPPAKKYRMSLEGTHTLVFTALQDLKPMPPKEPGFKQLHMLLFGFKNPPAGLYPIKVAAETGSNGAMETGTSNVRILSTPRPKINVTSLLFKPGGLNAIYQATSPGLETPRPYDFLLWDRNGNPFENVTIVDNKLVRGGDVVGRVSIQAPAGAKGYMIRAIGNSVRIKSPVTGVPTAHLRVAFRAGMVPGNYSATFQMDGGTAQTMYMRVK